MYVQGRTERVFPTADIQTHFNTWCSESIFVRRYGLKRKIDEVQTEYGTVHVKRASGYGVVEKKTRV